MNDFITKNRFINICLMSHIQSRFKDSRKNISHPIHTIVWFGIWELHMQFSGMKCYNLLLRSTYHVINNGYQIYLANRCKSKRIKYSQIMYSCASSASLAIFIITISIHNICGISIAAYIRDLDLSPFECL